MTNDISNIVNRASEIVATFDYYTDDFSKDEQRFLDRWLLSYIELELGRSPNRKAEQDIVAMLKRDSPVVTVGMEAYLKWRAGASFQVDPSTAYTRVGGKKETEVCTWSVVMMQRNCYALSGGR